MRFSLPFRKISAFALIFAAGVLAFSLGYRLVFKSDNRNPAAVPSIHDLSKLEGSALITAAKDRLILGTKVVRAGSMVGVELGHFLTKNSGGIASSVCDVYGEIEITFEATNMAVSGEAPLMIVRGFCEPSETSEIIEPLMLNFSEVLSKKVIDRKFSSVNGTGTSVSFKNVSDSWPDAWVVRSVRLHNTQAEIKVEIDEYRRLLGQPVLLEL